MKLTQEQKNEINYLYGYVLDDDIATDAICQVLKIIGVEHKELYANGTYFIKFFDLLKEGDAE